MKVVIGNVHESVDMQNTFVVSIEPCNVYLAPLNIASLIYIPDRKSISDFLQKLKPIFVPLILNLTSLLIYKICPDSNYTTNRWIIRKTFYRQHLIGWEKDQEKCKVQNA